MIYRHIPWFALICAVPFATSGCASNTQTSEPHSTTQSRVQPTAKPKTEMAIQQTTPHIDSNRVRVDTGLPLLQLDVVRKMHMFDAQSGFISGFQHGQFQIGITGNGGQTWRKVPSPNGLPSEQEGFVNAPVVAATSLSQFCIAWVYHNQIEVRCTQTAGRHWSSATIPLSQPLGLVSNVTFAQDGKHGFLLAQSSGASGRTEKTIFATTDGGTTWHISSADNGYIPSPQATKDALPEASFLLDFEATSTNDVWAGMMPTDIYKQRYFPLYRAKDSGQQWNLTDITIPKQDNTAKNLVGMLAPSLTKQMGMTIGYAQPVSGRGPLQVEAYTTKDGGDTWSLSGGIKVDSPFVTSMTNGHIAWLGEIRQPVIWTTVDSGQHWQQVTPDSVYTDALKSAGVHQLDVVNAATAFVVLTTDNAKSSLKDRSILLKTTDGGQHWSKCAL